MYACCVSLGISLHIVSVESRLCWMHRQQFSTEYWKGFYLWKHGACLVVVNSPRYFFFSLMLMMPLSFVSFQHSVRPVRVPFWQVILSCLFLASLKLKTITFVFVPVCPLILLDNFKDVRVVRRGMADIRSLSWLVLQWRNTDIA